MLIELVFKHIRHAFLYFILKDAIISFIIINITLLYALIHLALSIINKGPFINNEVVYYNKQVIRYIN